MIVLPLLLVVMVWRMHHAPTLPGQHSEATGHTHLEVWDPDGTWTCSTPDCPHGTGYRAPLLGPHTAWAVAKLACLVTIDAVLTVAVLA